MNKGLTGAIKLTMIFIVLLITFIFIFNFIVPSFANIVPDSGSSAYTWTTDVSGNLKTDFAPYTKVYIHGSNFLANNNVDFSVTRPDSFVENGNTISNADGSFVYEYQLDGIEGLYNVLATDGVNTAETTFTDGVNVNLDQWANKDNAWINGDLNPSKANYTEGEAVPFRLIITGLSVGSHYININYDFTSGGIYAYDFLTKFDLNESPNISADTAVPLPGGPISNYTIPSDAFDNVAWYELPNSQRYISIKGGNITKIDAITHSGSVSGNSNANMKITFNTGSCTSDCTIFLLWGGHLASELDWGDGKGASSISGAPFHMRTQNLDDGGSKNQDRSIQPGAISPPQLCSNSETLKEFLYESKPNYAHVDSSTTNVSFKLCNNTSVSVDTSDGNNHYVYMNWNLGNISNYTNVLYFKLLLYHYEDSTLVKVQLKNQTGSWIDVCDPSESTSYIWSVCDLAPYLNILQNVPTIELRLVAKKSGACHEYLGCAMLKVRLYKCERNEYCGDGIVKPPETCELPNTNNNPFCSQTTTDCLGMKFGQRDAYGDCDDNCGCINDPFTYSCVKDTCGAVCDDVSDCSEKCLDKKWYSSYGCTDNCDCDLGNLICSVGHCGAECDKPEDCENKCVDNTWKQGTCLDSCICSYTETNCDDGNVCTTDSCDSVLGCQHTPIPNCCITNDDCDDSDACTNDVCESNVCKHTTVTCDDSVGCTDDTCDTIKGCIYEPDDSKCPTDTACMDYFCDATKDCQAKYSPLSTPCEADGDLCTIDHCDGAGSCTLLDNVDCSDLDDQCQEGVCNPSDGECYPDYSKFPLSTPCEFDGDLCTIDHCDGDGSCETFDNVDVPPAEECKSFYCDPKDGKVKEDYTDFPLSTPCASDDVCELNHCDGSGECVFWKNISAPSKPIKVIGDPKIKCAEGEWCEWRITTLTPITLTCEEGKIHWRYALDEEWNDWNDDGSTVTIYFPEESNHTLEAYCLNDCDKSEYDIEKFKVEGTAFEIPLYKKWNLISVPFALTNDSVSEVFKNISDKIVSVWTYDNGSWYVWIPGLGGTLTSIKPGWGYWVIAKEDIKLLISGSLFSPITTPPSKELQSGWNLIGYYGTEWQIYELEEDDSCGYINPLYGNYVYCSLNSLVDTQRGLPRWSSLWGYDNCGEDVAYWHQLESCADEHWDDNRMYAGKGYWIEMDVKDSYAPATNCIWNEDLHCSFPTI